MKLNKKAEFDLQSFLVTFVFFIGIMVTFGLAAVNVGNTYQPLTNNTVDSTFAGTYNKLSSLESKTQEIQAKVENTQTGTQDSQSEFLGDALNSLKLIVPALQSTNSMINDMAKAIGLPVIWFRVLSLVVIIMLITVILFMIFRYR